MPIDFTKNQDCDKDTVLVFYITMVVYAVGLVLFNYFHPM